MYIGAEAAYLDVDLSDAEVDQAFEELTGKNVTRDQISEKVKQIVAARNEAA